MPHRRFVSLALQLVLILLSIVASFSSCFSCGALAFTSTKKSFRQQPITTPPRGGSGPFGSLRVPNQNCFSLTRSWSKKFTRQPTRLAAASISPAAAMSQMAAFVATLTVPQCALLALYGPSAVNKFLLRKAVMRRMWPTLPTWIWPATAAWEGIATALATVWEGSSRTVGLTMLYAFMGGVVSSLVYIRDENGYTHLSGKGKLGNAGLLPFIPTVGCTILLHLADPSLGFLWPCTWMAFGFGIGVWIYESSPSKFVR